MKLFSLQYKYITCILFMAILTGCTMPKQIQSPQPLTIPGQYPVPSQDTTVIVNKSWKQFFNDPNLIALIDTALRNNTDLQRSLQRIAIARAQVQSAKGAMLPTADFVVAGAFDRYGKYTLNGVGNFDTNLSPNIDKNQKIPVTLTPDLFTGIRSSWEADIWGKLKSRKKTAYLRYLASEKGSQWMTTQLVSQIASLYYTLIALDQEKNIIEQNISLQEKALDIVKAQKSGGRATELAVQQFNAQLHNTKAALFLVLQRISESENTMSLLAGGFSQPVQRSKNMTTALLKTASNGRPLQLLSIRPDIQQAELELAATGAEIETARKAFMPSFTITAYTALNAFKASLLFSPSSIAYGAMGGLAMPLFNRQQLKTQYAIATASQADAFYQYRQTVLNAFQEVTTNLQGINNYEQAYQLKLKEKAILEAAVQTAYELYVVGYASYLEVITAQKGVLEAALGAVQQQQAAYLTKIDLYRSLGGGWQ